MNIPPCIICGKELEGVGGAEENDINQPYGGTTFMTHGHFGSTVFDPMNPLVWLEINVCDECLTERQERVLHVTKAPQGFAVPQIAETWNRFKHG